MRKVLLLLILAITVLTLSSCLLFHKDSYYPDMVEHSEEDVLRIAKEKYSIEEFIFIGQFLRGEVKNTDNSLEILPSDCNFSTNFINGDNINAAMSAFAGKNGGHDVQGIYNRFLSYVALARCSDGTLKYIYYNTNLDKDADIYDTIGASDYNLEVSPTEISDSLFTASSDWGDMIRYLSSYKGLNPRDFSYLGDKLTYSQQGRTGGYTEIEFYKENSTVVFDIYHDFRTYDSEQRRLVYSSSERYGVIYHSNDRDPSEYFDVSQTISQSLHEENIMELWGFVEAKDINGTVLYSNISYRAEYQILRDGNIINYERTDSVTDKLIFDKGYGMDKIHGVDHSDTAKFMLTDYYIFYLKN